jgi:hypothetical protein
MMNSQEFPTPEQALLVILRKEMAHDEAKEFTVKEWPAPGLRVMAVPIYETSASGFQLMRGKRQLELRRAVVGGLRFSVAWNSDDKVAYWSRDF